MWKAKHNQRSLNSHNSEITKQDPSLPTLLAPWPITVLIVSECNCIQYSKTCELMPPKVEMNSHPVMGPSEIKRHHILKFLHVMFFSKSQNATSLRYVSLTSAQNQTCLKVPATSSRYEKTSSSDELEQICQQPAGFKLNWSRNIKWWQWLTL